MDAKQYLCIDQNNAENKVMPICLPKTPSYREFRVKYRLYKLH